MAAAMARDGRAVAAWLAVAAASFALLPWYFTADKSLARVRTKVKGW